MSKVLLSIALIVHLLELYLKGDMQGLLLSDSNKFWEKFQFYSLEHKTQGIECYSLLFKNSMLSA